MDRTILHCDCNGFYASVECLLRPELREIPMAVCGDPENRGGWGAYLSVPAALSHIISANRCVGETISEIPSEHKRVILHRFTGGLPAFKNGSPADVLLYEVLGGDHSWSDRYIPTCDLVWEFFSRYVR